MLDDNIQELMAMRDQVLKLELNMDPLLSGLMMQLVGTIDALIAIAATPSPKNGDIPMQAGR